MQIEYCKIMSPPLCRRYSDKIWVFGDNLKKYGKGGQAIIRDEPNAFGIPTKRYPSRDDWAYFSDKADEIEAVKNALRQLYKIAQEKTIVFPEDGIGTGLARMEEKSPVAYKLMCDILEEHFRIVNGTGDKECK